MRINLTAQRAHKTMAIKTLALFVVVEVVILILAIRQYMNPVKRAVKETINPRYTLTK